MTTGAVYEKAGALDKEWKIARSFGFLKPCGFPYDSKWVSHGRLSVPWACGLGKDEKVHSINTMPWRFAWDQSPAAPESPQSSAAKGSPGHIFWVFPAFNVNYGEKFRPLTPREKFDEWLPGVYDPEGLGVYAVESATLEYSSSDGFCGYGKGWDGYGKCFGSMELDANISSFFGDFLFPVIMHQDPRYFRLGQGSFGARLFYAVSRVFITHADSGRWVFYSSALSGTVLAAAASNLYYPRQDRGFGSSLDRAGIDLGDTALYNVSAEFWPDIKHKLYHAFGHP